MDIIGMSARYLLFLIDLGLENKNLSVTLYDQFG